jgi:hypothetical protein
MNLRTKLLTTLPIKEKSQIIWDHYLSRQLKTDLEPNWIHSGYDLIRRVALGEETTKSEGTLLIKLIQSHSTSDGEEVASLSGRPKSVVRIMHDGWKAGSPTWIFMGRSAENVQSLGEDWVAVKRTLPDHIYNLIDQDIAPPTLWLAYNLNLQMGFDNKNVIGPAISLEQLTDAVKKSYTNT